MILFEREAKNRTVIISPGEKAYNNIFLHKVFWSFLQDFNLLNQNALSARRESLRNFCTDAKNQDGRQK